MLIKSNSCKAVDWVWVVVNHQGNKYHSVENSLKKTASSLYLVETHGSTNHIFQFESLWYPRKTGV